MAQELEKGLFITFEGPEGSGKSTQSRRLCKDLESDGYDVEHTREPGGTVLGMGIRSLLLEKETIRLDKKAELFLFEADRAQHIEEVIKPSLAKNKIVLCDRFNTATFAYQGYGLGMDMDKIELVDQFATDETCPDLTVLLDVDVETGLRRATANSEADRMEKRDKVFHEKVREGYLDLAKKNPEKIKVVRSEGDIDETYSLVKGEVYGFLARHKGTE